MSATNRRQRLGVVIGGTGVRGFAQAGALRALERSGLAPDVVVGVSTGAIVAATYSARPDWLAALQNLDRTRLPSLGSGVVESDYFAGLRSALHSARQLAPSVWTWGRQGFREYARTILSDLLGEQSLDDGRVRIAQVATDLAGGQRVVLDRGPLVDATLAASALPGVMGPVSVDGSVLVDGAFTDPAPVDVARDLGADVVLVVHALGELSVSEVDNWLLALVRGLEIGQHAFAEERLAEADVVIRADLGEEVRSLDFAGIDVAARRTAEAVGDQIGHLRDALGRPASA